MQQEYKTPHILTMEKTLSVSAIRDGTVIDHIPAGSGFAIIQLLGLLTSEFRVTIGLNLPSKRLRLKDLVKIENRFLTEKEASEIAVYAPTATLSIIRDFQVEKKLAACLPPVVEGLLQCPNPNCLTRTEPMKTRFFVEEWKQQIHLRCKYCEKTFERDLMQ